MTVKRSSIWSGPVRQAGAPSPSLDDMQPDAEVRLPAESAYVAVLRMAAAGIAARLDYTLDDVEDLRMAVSEACSMVLAQASPGGTMSASFFLAPDRMEVRVSADADNPASPDEDGFGWQVLSTTASAVSAAVGPDTVMISFTVPSSATDSPA
ncbi:MAG: rsbW [Marmoricola sp.]|nr:rsbW [Marmoricola sp.]